MSQSNQNTSVVDIKITRVLAESSDSDVLFCELLTVFVSADFQPELKLHVMDTFRERDELSCQLTYKVELKLEKTKVSHGSTAFISTIYN